MGNVHQTAKMAQIVVVTRSAININAFRGNVNEMLIAAVLWLISVGEKGAYGTATTMQIVQRVISKFLLIMPIIS